MSTVRWNRFVAAAVDGLEWPTSTCQTQLRSVPVVYNQNGVRACGRPVTSGGSCLSASHHTASPTPRSVDVHVYGYQKGSPDAFSGRSQVNANGNYVDGISITRGSPRKHLWTYAA